MTPEEYKKKLKELEQEYRNKRNCLAIDYALSDNHVQIGDTITDHIGSIVVDKIKVGGHNWESVECIYEGYELTKQGKPYKNKRRRVVWQTNLKE